MSRRSSTSNWSRRARKRYRREDSYYQTEADKIKIALIKDEFLNHIIFGQKHPKDRKKAADILFFGLSNRRKDFQLIVL